MNDSHTADQSVISQVDFAKYQTPELFDWIAEFISLPGKIRMIFIWTFLGAVVLACFVFWSFHHRLPFPMFVVTESYAIIAGAVAGFALGLAETIRRSVAGMLRIVDLLLQTTADVAVDVRRVRSGQQEMPRPAELVDIVYHQVFVPVVGSVISNSLGIFGKPILWFYGSTLGRLEKRVIRNYVPDSYDAPETAAQRTLIDGAAGAGDATAQQEHAIVANFQWARERIAGVGGWLKLLVMLPCYFAFTAILLAIALPLIIVWFLFAVEKIALAFVVMA